MFHLLGISKESIRLFHGFNFLKDPEEMYQLIFRGYPVVKNED